jgi:uncharacterized membrane protein YczE
MTTLTSPLSMNTRLVRLVVSWALVGVGVPLLIRAELGVAPFDVLNTGIAEATGWSLGLAFIIDSVVFFTAGALLGARLGPACVAGTVVIGLMVNVVLGALPDVQALVPRTGLLVGGILVIAVAICLVVSTEFGPGPTETVMLGLIHRGLGVVPARWIADGVPLVAGAALGGQIGIGTVTFLVAMGPLVKFGLRVIGYRPTRRPPASPVFVGR